jgi:heme exporter protein B
MSSTFLRQTWALVRKDLRHELRNGEVVTTALSFSVLLTILFTFAFYQNERTVSLVFPGILWISIVFTGTLVVTRTFSRESESGCLRAMALVPGSEESLYASKMVVNLLFMGAFELVLLPFLGLAFDIAIVERLPAFVAILATGTLGFTAIGTLVSAMLVGNRLRDVLLPIVLYPLSVPLLIGGVLATRRLISDDGTAVWGWVRIMGAMDIALLFVGYVLFRWVLRAVE